MAVRARSVAWSLRFAAGRGNTWEGGQHSLPKLFPHPVSPLFSFLLHSPYTPRQLHERNANPIRTCKAAISVKAVLEYLP